MVADFHTMLAARRQAAFVASGHLKARQFTLVALTLCCALCNLWAGPCLWVCHLIVSCHNQLRPPDPHKASHLEAFLQKLVSRGSQQVASISLCMPVRLHLVVAMQTASSAMPCRALCKGGSEAKGFSRDGSSLAKGPHRVAGASPFMSASLKLGVAMRSLKMLSARAIPSRHSMS